MTKIEVFENKYLVGELCVLDRDTYSFSYVKSWLDSNHSFQIDPQLPLNDTITYSDTLWGAFMDISPDRWGRLIQSRNANRFLSDNEYMLGVSDYFRVGALRLRLNGEFVSPSNDIPRLININAIKDSTLRVENDTYTKQDLEILLYPSSSLGGARPKASIMDNDKLFIAKFPSKNDITSVIAWECVMLELSKLAKINTADFKMIKSSDKSIILVERFDRKNKERIPFISAMTLLGVNERENAENKSYADIANKLDSANKKELFRRMVFNGLFGNTDDHLRNHALLYDKDKKKWNLSPAYDMNPNPLPYDKQHHALNFIDKISLPSIELFKNIAKEFEINNTEFKEILRDCLNAGQKYKEIAIKYGIKANEIKMFSQNFQHDDLTKAKSLINSKSNQSKINSQNLSNQSRSR